MPPEEPAPRLHS